MNGLPPASRRICVVIDIERFSGRGNVNQLAMQRTLRAIAASGISHAKLYWSDIEKEDKGDGLLMQLPPGVDEPHVIPALVNGLCLAVRMSNLRVPDSQRIRLRTALTQGIRHVGATGRVGDAVIAACRLVDCRELREAFAAHPNRDVAVIVADDLYRDVIAHGYPGLDPVSFAMVKVSIPAKGFEEQAWTCVPEPVTGKPEPARRDTRAVRSAATAAGLVAGGALLGGLIEAGLDHHGGGLEPDPFVPDSAVPDFTHVYEEHDGGHAHHPHAD